MKPAKLTAILNIALTAGLTHDECMPLQHKSDEYFDYIEHVCTHSAFKGSDNKKGILLDLLKYNSREEFMANAMSKVQEKLNKLASRGPMGKALSSIFTALVEEIEEDEQEEEETRALMYEIEKMPITTKVSQCMEIAHKLDKLHARSKHTPNEMFNIFQDGFEFNVKYWNNFLHALRRGMRDDHYKTCDCASKKFDVMIRHTDMDAAIKEYDELMQKEGRHG